MSSCQNYDKPISIKNEKFEVVLPGFVQKEELAEDAALEYANRFRNFYVVAFILKDNVSQDSLWAQTTTRITSALMNPTVDSIHQPNHIFTKITGKFKDEKEPLYYSQKLIYRKGNSLLLTIWTRGKEREKKYEVEVERIMSSFKSMP
jgi:hypothetical protein